MGFYDIWDIVENGYDEPIYEIAEAALSEVEKTALNESRKKNNKAFFMIYQGVDEPTFDIIAEARRVKDAWQILQNSFQGIGKEKEVELGVPHDDFENYKIKSSENISEHVSHLKMVIDEIKKNNENHDDTSHLGKILQRKVSLNNNLSGGSFNISGKTPRKFLSMDNIYEATSAAQITFEYFVFCLNVSGESNKSREQGHHKIAERVHYKTGEILDDLLMKSLKWGVFHKMKDKLEIQIRV